jgi:biotin operon repressor
MQVVSGVAYLSSYLGESITGKRLLTDCETSIQLWALVPVNSRKPTDLKEFITVFQPAFDYLARHPLTPNETRIFNYLLSRLDMQNFIALSAAGIAKDIGIDRSNVSKAIKGLVTRGIIDEQIHMQIGNLKTYRLNAYVAWRGAHHQAKSEQAKSAVVYETDGNVIRIKSFNAVDADIDDGAI